MHRQTIPIVKLSRAILARVDKRIREMNALDVIHEIGPLQARFLADSTFKQFGLGVVGKVLLNDTLRVI